jgi:hypothetical protein
MKVLVKARGFEVYVSEIVCSSHGRLEPHFVLERADCVPRL